MLDCKYENFFNAFDDIWIQRRPIQLGRSKLEYSYTSE